MARATAEKVTVGEPEDPRALGPVVSRVQFDKIQRLIQVGMDEGAEVVAGGLGRPEGLDVGYYVRPTVFGNVGNDMTVAREEIFGPVLCILGYDDLDEAVVQNDILSTPTRTSTVPAQYAKLKQRFVEAGLVTE